MSAKEAKKPEYSAVRRIGADKAEVKDPAQERVEIATQGCLRTLSLDGKLAVHFSSEEEGLSGEVAQLSLPQPLPPGEALSAQRGRADALACRKLAHNEELHQKLAPQSEAGRELYDALEATRAEIIGSTGFDGIAANLDSALNEKHQDSTAPISAVEGMALLARQILTGRDLPENAKYRASSWQEELAPHAAALASMSQSINDQDHFARFSRKLISALKLGEAGEDDADLEMNLDPTQDDQGDADDSDHGDGEGNEQEDGQDEAQEQSELGSMDDDEEPEEGDVEAGASERSFEGTESKEERYVYKVYSRRDDEVVRADKLAKPRELSDLREQLDNQLGDMQALISRVAARLQHKLMAQQQHAWHYQMDEGFLDTNALPTIISSPANPLAFKQQHSIKNRDTVVTLLLDNSGSMRGRPISIAAACADVLARTLERCGVKVEILGFTTCAWKGGQSRKAWLDAGSPENPGRLNDTRHIIYKSANDPLRRTTKNLGLMLQGGLLKENIDGEALQWAHRRLLARNERRKILMMISDGAPIDDSTLSSNPAGYLEKHLRQVIDEVENRSAVELLAIGIGHDVTQYYDHAVTIISADQLAHAMTEELVKLFDQNLG